MEDEGGSREMSDALNVIFILFLRIYMKYNTVFKPLVFLY